MDRLKPVHPVSTQSLWISPYSPSPLLSEQTMSAKQPLTINKRPRDDLDGDDEKDVEHRETKQLVHWLLESRGVTDKKAFHEQAAREEGAREEDEKGDEAVGSGKLSQLIPFEKEGLCSVGHGRFMTLNMDKNTQCTQCGAKKQNEFCADCYSIAGQNDRNKYVHCIDCRVRNKEILKERAALKQLKADFIRDALQKDRSLELDLLCGLPKKSALDDLMEDIYNLQRNTRAKFCILMMDLDHLKIWNDVLGHSGADDVIQGVGDVLKSHKQEVDDGKWTKKGVGQLKRAWSFRTGGDEFVFVLQCGGNAYKCKMGVIYNSIKKQVNELGNDHKNAVQQYLAENKKKELVDRKGRAIQMDKVGISTGVYIPLFAEDKDWIFLADKVALEKAKEMNMPQKNRVAVYYEREKGVVSAEIAQKKWGFSV